MRKVLVTSLFCCLLVATSLLLPACEEVKEEGQLPDWQVGDSWTWSYVMEGVTRTLTEEVIDEETVEGRACYVVDMVFDPTMSWSQGDTECSITGIKYWGDKATGFWGIKHEMTTTCNGQAYTSTEIYVYSPWASLFPLEIDKEVEMEKTTTQYFDGEQTGDPVVTTEKYQVDSTEDVTVTAGTFSCWKLIMSDGAGNVTQTMWYSDEAKTMVKSTDADGNTIMELQSYSVE
jgi:hypothetical protein